MNRTLNTQNATALQTWHQGAILTKMSDGQEGQHLMCPHCGQPATAVHLLWLCKETQKRFPALTNEDKIELEHGLNLEFWSQGLLIKPATPIATGGASVQAWGTWTTQDEARIISPDVVSIGISSTSTDCRLKHYAVAIVHHTQIGGQLYRRGAVVAILPGTQSWERAWYYGIRMVAHYVDLHQRIILHVQSTRAWEAWQQNRHAEVFHDLRELITLDQKSRVKVLCISSKQLKDTPNHEWSLRHRQEDACKTAKEIALGLQPTSQEEELVQQDDKYKRIAPQAIQRIRYLIEDKQHFMNAARETGKIKRDEAGEAKKEAYRKLSVPSSPNSHVWEPKGRGLKCRQCQATVTMHSKLTDLQDAATAACPKAADIGVVGGSSGTTDKATLLQRMLTGTCAGVSDHTFSMQKHYIVCGRCNQRLLKNSAKEKLQELAAAPCWDCEWPIPAAWAGHATHQMWRKGNKVFCKRCTAHVAMKEGQPQASKQLQKSCAQGHTTQLPLCFRPKDA